MSKLYNKYENLKKENTNKLYSFLCGNFYIALDSDAIILNELFDFKLTKFSNICDKCGFPKSSLNKYKELFDTKGIDYEVIYADKTSDDKLNEILEIINNSEINKISKKDAKNIILNIKSIILS